MLGRKNQLQNKGSEIYLFCFNTKGEIEWEYIFENDFDIGETPNDYTLDNEGNILVIGEVTTFVDSDYDIFYSTENYILFKLSSEGELIWDKRLESPDLFHNYGTSVKVNSLGEIFTIGQIAENEENFVFLHKFDSDGNQIFAKKIDNLRPHKLEIVNDELLIICQQSGGLSNVYKYDFGGNELSSFSIEIGWAKPIIDINGNIYNFSFTGKFRIDKYNSEGIHQWAYHRPSNLPSNVHADQIHDLSLDDEGNVYITGRHYGEHYGDTTLYTNCDILTTKLDSEGNILWENIYNYDNKRSCQIGERILPDTQGNIFVLGSQSVEKNGYIFASRDMVLLTYNQEGERIDSIYHNSSTDKDDRGINFFMRGDTIYTLGYSEDAGLSERYNIIKYIPGIVDHTNDKTNLKVVVYPNPNNGKFIIESNEILSDVSVFDLLGRKIFVKSKFSSGSSIDLSNEPPGIYYLTYIQDQMRYTKTIVRIEE